MNIFRHLEQMQPFLHRADWCGLEQAYESVCRVMAGDEQARRIAAVDLLAYREALAQSLAAALSEAQRLRVKATYFEYDMNNRWESAFFLCRDYFAQPARDNDWTSDWEVAISGPDLPQFGELYSENGFDRSMVAIGSTLLLVARTVAAFGKAAAGIDTGDLALCIAFHDQNPVMRVREP